MSNLFPPSDSKNVFLSQASLEQFRHTLPNLSFAKLAECFEILPTQPSLQPSNKLVALFHFLDEKGIIDKIGKYFTASSFIHFLNFLSVHPSYLYHLPQILVGLHPLIFSASLKSFQESHLSLLKREGLLEPLQYHLIQFIHEGESLNQSIYLQAQQFMQDMQFIEAIELTSDQLNVLIQGMDALRNHLLDYLERAAIALSIVWNTDRIDLIEKLNSIQDIIKHQLSSLIGHPQIENTSSTGLYLKVENMLSKVFDSSLKTDDAAIEGLTRLSIWHLKDYWDLGLLPHIQDPHELDTLPLDIGEQQKHLFFQVQQQLNRLKIGTVGDLKKNYLFSKHLLKAYIEQHRSLLA